MGVAIGRADHGHQLESSTFRHSLPRRLSTANLKSPLVAN
jgi:hypothetical protein